MLHSLYNYSLWFVLKHIIIRISPGNIIVHLKSYNRKQIEYYLFNIKYMHYKRLRSNIYLDAIKMVMIELHVILYSLEMIEINS